MFMVSANISIIVCGSLLLQSFEESRQCALVAISDLKYKEGLGKSPNKCGRGRRLTSKNVVFSSYSDKMSETMEMNF